jgi:beta-galactosidase
MLFFGGDYNPEQWPEDVWAQDLVLMRHAGVNLVTVGVFSWSRLQPAPDQFDFDWLDRVLDGLHANGIGVCLATPTASPPPWFTRLHPDAMPVNRDGVRLTHGSRDTYCVNAPAYQAASALIVAELAQRYGSHPAVRLWHVHNEYGTWCFCSHCESAFQQWLLDRYSTLDTLNEAWSTDFWSQRYGQWDEILPPRTTQYLPNPAHALDYRRFLSDAFLRHFSAQRKQLAITAAPVTTNFVMGSWVPVNHARWAREVDLVAIDHYPHGVSSSLAERAFASDRARGWALAAGHPGGRWLLMEHAPGAVHADGVTQALPAGSVASAAEAYLERGAVGVLYFQWRASRGGAEQWHPAMLPHEGPTSPVFQELSALGQSLRTRAPVTVVSDVALIFDEETMWAWQGDHHMTRHLDYETVVRQWHTAMTSAYGNVDVIPPGAPLSSYRIVVAPALYLMSQSTREALASFTGTLVLTSGTGLVDDCVRVTPGWIDDFIGARILRRTALPPDAAVTLDDGRSGRLLFDSLELTTATVLQKTADGSPAVIKNGSVIYIATLDVEWLPPLD